MSALKLFLRYAISFRGRLTLWLGGLTFATLLIVGGYVGRIAAGEISSSNGETLYLAAKAAADLLSTNLRERMQEVDLLRHSPVLTSGDLSRQEIREQIDLRKSVHSEYAWIGIADPHGTVIQGTGGLLVGENVGQRPWFQGVVNNDLFIGDMHEAVLLAKRLPNVKQDQPLRFIDFAALIRDTNGNIRGVLGTHAHWSWVTEMVESVVTEQAAKKKVDVLIVGKNGNVVYPQELVDLTLPSGGWADTRYSVLEWGDGRFLTSIVPVKEVATQKLEWNVILRQPLDDARMPIAELWERLIWSGIFASMLISVIGLRFAQRISRPIEQLVKAVAQAEIPNGSPNYPKPQNIPEFDKLNAAIQSTTDSLLDRERQLEKLNSSLEQLVEERTEELTVANRQLEYLSISDALTGVNNRRRFDQKLHEYFAMERRGGSCYALLIIDVDHFKNINDTYGHQVGDVVLQKLAALLKDNVRDTDFVARYGGEEFVALLYGIGDFSEGLTVAEKLRTTISEYDFPRVGRVTISLGLSVSSGRDELDSQIIQRADSALYAAKGNGRNRVEVVVP